MRIIALAWVLLMCAGFSEVPMAGCFYPGRVWTDTNGAAINAHGGGLLYHEGIYYWYGEHKVEGEAGNFAVVGVHCYSSTDLYNWHDEGIVLPVSNDRKSEIAKGCILERPKVIFNEKTGKFVMWFHLEWKGTGYSTARSGVAVGDSPTGPFAFLKSVRPNAGHWPLNSTPEQREVPEEGTVKKNLNGAPNLTTVQLNILGRDFETGQMARDMTLFVDDDGSAYHIFSSEENSTLHISRLTDDYLALSGEYVRVFPHRWMEAPAICKRDGKYYLLASGCTGWAPNAARGAVAENIFGPWLEFGNPCDGVNPQNGLGPEKTFGAQSTYIQPVYGKKNAYIAMFDLWNPKNAIDGRYAWLPVVFEKNRFRIQWMDEWDLSFFDSTEQSVSSEHVFHPGSGDAVPKVFQTLEKCRAGDVLRFEKGEYHFCPDDAFENYYYISNNRHGLKRVAFPIIGKENLTIDGGGSRFVFHGEVIPFVLENSSGIVLKNFSIDWERPFYSQGVIVYSDENRVDVQINRETYPYHFDEGRIFFDGEGWSQSFSEGIFEMDARTHGPAYLSGDNLGGGIPPHKFNVSEAGSDTIRFSNSFRHRATVGNILLLRHYPRLCPGIHLKQSRNVLLENVHLYHAGGMGLIAQLSENVHLKNCSVQPAPGSGRYFSVTVDATHFVNCRGQIRLENCRFENQMDDPCNVHGINSRIKERVDDFSLITELVHPEQRGVEIGFAGDRMSFAHNDDLLVYAERTVQSVEPVDSQYVKVTFSEKLPEDIRAGDVLDNMSWAADVLISGCENRNNRARGYLLSTPGKIVLKNNRIAAAGAAVKISGDANFWFESGGVRDVLISDNLFEDSCYGAAPWGTSVICVDPVIAEPHKNRECFHRNIRIENNTFRTFDAGVVYARSVDGISFRSNTVERTETYPFLGRADAVLTFEACRNIDVNGNRFDPRIREPIQQVDGRPRE